MARTLQTGTTNPAARWASSWPGGVLLIAFCLAAYLPGLRSVPPLDGDEARYAESARRMLASHDWQMYVVPRIEGAIRLNKPPLVYWLQAATAYVVCGGDPDTLAYPKALLDEAQGHRTLTGSPATRSSVFTGGIAAFRLASVIATILATLAIWRLGARMFAPPCALLAAALWAGCFIVVIDARLARTDQILAMFTCVAQWALWNVWRQRDASPRWVVLFWVAVGLGIMTKGPVTPGVSGLTVLCLCVLTRDRSLLRRLRFGLGALILAAVILPWVALAIHAVGWQVFAQTMWQELLLRGMSASGGRAGPPGYHAVLLWGLFWPGVLLLIPAMILAVRRGLRWKRQTHRSTDTLAPGWRSWLPLAGRPAECFCLAWLVPSWLVCEFVETKLPHYTLPLYPAIALLCGRAGWSSSVGAMAFMRSKLTVIGDSIWTLVGAGVCLALPLYLASRGDLRAEPGVLLALLASGVVTAAVLIAAWMFARRIQFVVSLSIALWACALGGRCLFQIVLPNLESPWMTSAVVRELAEIDPQADRPHATAGYYRESLDFLTGGRIETLAPTALDDWLAEHPDGIAIVPKSVPLPRQSTTVRATIEGFDYVEGDHSTLLLLEGDAAPADESTIKNRQK